MPWSATTSEPGRRGQRLAQLLGLGVDHRELLEPLGGGDAVPVAGPVEVAVVDVGQRRLVRRRADGGGDPLADAVGADVRRPALRGDRQPGAVELALVDRRDVHPGAREPGERGRVRLPLERVDVLVPPAGG